MQLSDLKKANLPETPGVYFFWKGKDILYIGKATSLRDRVRSYFSADLIDARGPHILDMVTQSTGVTYEATRSVLEALILEASLIKKHQPKYNTKEKDNKSFNYVVITDEPLPRVLLVRGRNLTQSGTIERLKPKYSFGPFPSGTALREALKIIRKIFPFIDDSSLKKDNAEFYRQLGLTPDTRDKEIVERYRKTIQNIVLLFQNKKDRILKELTKNMHAAAKKQHFEQAGEYKRQIFALEHIRDVALIKDEERSSWRAKAFRIEAYDVAHLSGTSMVGVMTVVENGIPEKSEYRKFTIETRTTPDDPACLEEVLSRRLRHTEWGLPELIVVDGNQVQIRVAEQVLKRYQFDIPVVSVVKDASHKAREILGETKIAALYKKSIILANSEAHRFSIAFHRQKRAKKFLGS